MKKFDGVRMKGRTDEDNTIILKTAEKEIEMIVDDQRMIVYNEGGQYIADYEDVEEGYGIFC
jgi:hypothetical protein